MWSEREPIRFIWNELVLSIKNNIKKKKRDELAIYIYIASIYVKWNEKIIIKNDKYTKIICARGSKI